MIARLTTRLPHRLLDLPAARQLERLALEQFPAYTLMQRAGTSVARLALALAPHARHIWIACGPGNNGGDGFEAAVQLHEGGHPVSVGYAGDPAKLPPDAKTAFDRAQAAGVSFNPTHPPKVGAQDLYIDALLGVGGRDGDIPAWMQASLAALHCAPCPVLAIDLPSGLCAGTGQYLKGFAPEKAIFSERHTISLLCLKVGLFTGAGRDSAGTLWFDDLGVDTALPASTLPTAWLGSLPGERPRAHASHKGSFGDVTIIGGEGLHRRGMGMGGAALLAGSAALHAGAGRVLVALLDGNADLSIDTSQPELMLRAPSALDLTTGTVVCGCGGGEAVRELLPKVLHEARTLVLDADALNAIATDPVLQKLLRDRAGLRRVTVLTPHPLEAARLLETSAAAVQADRVAAAIRLSERFDCIAAVKGSGTVIAAPGRVPVVNPTGNGRLATAGTGDVLAGMVGARLAAAPIDKGLLPVAEAFAATCDAVYHHGALADAWPAQLALTAGALARQSARN
jgi:hydroxyethylthiazole kinase-like uncharacterized protein yjeF